MTLPLPYAAFVRAVLAAANDSSSLIGAGGAIAGNVGRYAGPALYASTADGLAAQRARRQAVRAAVTQVLAATSNRALAVQMVGLINRVASYATPRDRLRLLAPLAAIDGNDVLTTTCRRLSLSRMARAAAALIPTSYEDAATIRRSLCALLDAEILRAADAAEGGVYKAFRAMRVAVARDLITRGGSLPHERQVTVPPLPAVVLAYRLYGDAGRAPELVRRADPANPSFMPTSLSVLDR